MWTIWLKVNINNNNKNLGGGGSLLSTALLPSVCCFKTTQSRKSGEHSGSRCPWNSASAKPFLIRGSLNIRQNITYVKFKKERVFEGELMEGRFALQRKLLSLLSVRAVTRTTTELLHLTAVRCHLPWNSRLFPPYAVMFCQATLASSALSKFHYGMAEGAWCCSLRSSAWHVTVCSTRDAGGPIA